MEIKEVRQDVQSMKTNMQMDRAHNATPEQSIEEFRKSKDGNQSERNKGLIGMTCKCLSHQSALNVDLTCLMVTFWNSTISCQYLRK